ncbi:AraC family transcriptional regulator [Shewanella atlantica]|uniref:AraC family transcriptional regulator n=1 Tax=Shewanella atlantica TaxID=271099 RepID=A0A431WBN1_9GAMM|nr:helix-turn-helix transcriptional regulator [Shewanella atlantica]RTR32759.1 AraC family transcriptional regulator [Shewanella atlantica]
MAFIKQENRFDVDTLDLPVVGIAADVGRHDSGMHSHQMAQLLYAPLGCMNITLDNTQCILPPTKAAWIPAGVEHCVQMRNVVAYRSVYFDIRAFPDLSQGVKIISVNALLQALIERMAMWEWDKPIKEQTAAMALLAEELEAAPEEPLLLPLPTDPRLKSWLSALRSGEELPLALKIMAKEIGASEKTISRIFSKQTGMPYQAWRQQWRLHGAIERLALGGSVSEVAFSLGFSSDSAFISFFKQHLGNTPSQYIKVKTAY